MSDHRLKRLHRWALLWLRWLADFLDAAEVFTPFSKEATAIAHRWLDRIERGVVCIVIIRAAPHVRTIASLKHAGRQRIETHFFRAVIGARMRRSLRSKNLRQRIATLSQDIGELVARLLKRLPRGLTRRRPIRTQGDGRRALVAAAAFARPAVGADTS